jgi:hypothetical protein
MAVAVEQTRHEWAEGHRRLEAELRPTPRGEAVADELDAVVGALRKRVGQHFTLAELVEEYEGADTWTREAVEEIGPAGGWPQRLATVTEAAFHVYSRGAVDYEP